MSTSLVFLVVLGMWAAYLTQQWMRRREHLSTARSVDAFTEALRVLDTTPATSGTARTRPSTTATTPARAAAPTAAGRTAPTRPGRRLRTAAHARMRALSLVGAALMLVTAVVATALGRVSWLVVPAAVCVVVGDIAYLRWSARVRRAGVPTASVAAVMAPRASVPDATPVAPCVGRAVEPEVDSDVVEPEVVVAQDVEVMTPPAPARELFDVRAFDEPAPTPVDAPVAPAEPALPGTWRPMSVPEPLYVRKAVVEPTTVAAAPAVVESDTHLSPVDIDDDLEVASPFAAVVNG